MTSDYPVSPDKSGVGHSAFLTLKDSHDLPQTWLPQTREQPEMPKRKEVTNNLISLFEAIYSIHKVYGGMLIYLLLIFVVVFCTYHHPFGVFSQPALGLFPVDVFTQPSNV
jgi:hypothetical protein